MILELPYHVIAETLSDAGIPEKVIDLPDALYALPAERDIPKIGVELMKVWRGLGFTYQPESRDCDDFARMAAALASHFNAINQRKLGQLESGFAFGEIWLASKSHALNVAVHRDDDGKNYVAAYEPQPQAGGALLPVTLERSDWVACTSCRI